MSYHAFTCDLSDKLGKSKAGGRDLWGAHRRVFDRWLAAGRHEGLIRYMVADFDGADGGEEYLNLLGKELVRIGRPDLIRKLYGPFINRRRNHYFWRRAEQQLHPLVPAWVKDFLNRVSPRRRELARYKLSVLALMQEFRAMMAATPGTNLSDIDRQIAAFGEEDAPARRPVPLATRQMREEGFWALISAARAVGETDDDVVATIEATLATLEPGEIVSFQSLLQRLLNQAHLWDLWAVAYAARSGCGDDEFDYFRQWLVLQGETVYEAAIANPVAWGIDFTFEGTSQCEGLLSAGPNAYRSKMKREMPQARPKIRTKPAGAAWKEDELAIRFPELVAHFTP